MWERKKLETDKDTLESRRKGNPLGRAAQNAGAVLLGLGLLLAKFKGLLLLLLNLKYVLIFGKVLALSWTFLLSLWLYVLFFGWRFAVVIMFLLLAHEFGHYAAFRAYGLPVRLPQFIPFLGAYTMGAVPKEPEHDAYISLAGPLTGLGLAVACYAIGAALHDPFWLAIANVSAFLNLFNMIPFPPFDGGRAIAMVVKSTGAPRWRTGAAYLAVTAGLIYILAVSHVIVATGRPF